ncbi:uncharacterized protein LOC114476556 isoform X2 [Gouania willdenowi]|uniref:uncharacterized protein LOC114476556 isoform X2 n=1 Tax=Gouania willdenowi TaxID=441366 RepID=UPI00105484B4|nr:uncharacterized protein LOC114476556 isoform X2 [Gouania willdenowi]
MRSHRARFGLAPPGEEPPPFDPGHPAWGPPPPGGWGPSYPGWDPRGPPPPDWDVLGPRPPGWDPRGPPYWDPRDPRGPPCDWDPMGPSWDPIGPPYWDPRGPQPPDWDTLGRPLPPPEHWRPPQENLPPWGAHSYPPPPAPSPAPPTLGPIPIAAMPPPVSAPPLGYLAVPPPGWTPEPIKDEPMLNPAPEQPEWIKALILAPANEAPKATDGAKAVKEAPAEAPPTATPDVRDVKKSTKTRTFGLLGRRTFDRPPAGRSTGIISFIGPSFGYIEREDLEKFTFQFNAFYGASQAMIPGVRVHFTACAPKARSPDGFTPSSAKQEKSIATDVKVAPGGTENVDPEILEGVVSQPITEPEPGGRQYPGQMLVTSGGLKTNLTYERKDSSVSLMKDDRVLFNMLTDIVTNKKRATNIRPQVPGTFTHTQETRHQGSIVSLKENSGLIKCDELGQLPFESRENLSEMEFSSEDVGEKVEFTVLELRVGKSAIRIKRVKESLLLALCSANTSTDGRNTAPSGRTITEDQLEPHMKLDTELYEGIVNQPIVRPTDTQPGCPGQIHANIGTVRTNVTFDQRDCRVTLLKNDHVLINLLTDTLTDKKRATNIRAKIPFTFSYTQESRHRGVIASLEGKEGVLKTYELGELPFDICENFSDTDFFEEDLQKEVEFTVLTENSKKRAIRLKRMKKSDDPILRGQKSRKKEQQKKQEVLQKDDKKDAVAAALVAAKNKWTPLGFTFSIPDSLEEISRERFEGTILQTVPSKQSPAHIKVEPEEEGRASEGHEVKVEPSEEGGAKEDSAKGRLVMTVDGQQKQLSFGLKDIMSTPTMMVGDKVRFNIATNPESKETRAMFVEILPDSFEESNEQRHQGIVIELNNNYGLIKCSENEQLFFHSSEVIEEKKKKLELNAKVDFTIVPHESAGGGQQAIRIKRYTESIFLPARKFGGLAENKGKMTIKLAMSAEESEKKKLEADKMKAVVKNLRSQDSKVKSSLKDQFGRVLKKRSPSIDRDSRRSRHRCSRERSSRRSRSRSTSRSRKRYRRRSQSPKTTRSKSSSSRSRSRSRSKDKEKVPKKRSREHEDSLRRKSPPHKRAGAVEEELARKKRELEELNDMIAYKKSLMDSRGQDLSQKACIDYNHGRNSVPLTQYKPVRSILKNRPDEPDNFPGTSYEKPVYSKPYSPFEEQQYRDCYGDAPDPYARHAYADRPYGDLPYDERPYKGRPYDKQPYRDQPYDKRLYGDRPYVDRPYEERLYGECPYESRLYEADPLPSLRGQYTDRYQVRDQTLGEGYYDSYDPPQRSKSLEAQGGFSPHGSSQEHMSTTQTAAGPTWQTSFRPSPPIDPPAGGASPTQKSLEAHLSPQAEKPPLDRFLEMLNKKNIAEPVSKSGPVMDDLLPHERAFQDGKGFSRLVGLPQEIPGLSLEVEKMPLGLNLPSAEEPTKEPKAESYLKIQNLLQTIGLKLSTEDVTKLANQAQEQISSSKSSSRERETSSLPRKDLQSSRTGSVESDNGCFSCPARSSSLEPLTKARMPLSNYQGYLENELQQLSKTTGSTLSTPNNPPPTNNTVRSAPDNCPPPTTTSTFAPALKQPRLPPGPPPGPPPGRPTRPPPGPPPGPPPRHALEQTVFASSSFSVVPFLRQVSSGPSGSSQLSQLDVPATQPSTLLSKSISNSGQATISTTVARCLKVIETVKSLAVQSQPKPLKSVKFTIPIEPSPVSLDAEQLAQDIQAKQKEKLDLYNQRVSEKREQQFREKLARRRERKNTEDGLPSIVRGNTGESRKRSWLALKYVLRRSGRANIHVVTESADGQQKQRYRWSLLSWYACDMLVSRHEASHKFETSQRNPHLVFSLASFIRALGCKRESLLFISSLIYLVNF